jgi:peptidoglycan/xylan/chitin deacetylase (PgdA/CDA1 family)
VAQRLDGWKQAVAGGHEIGNHSVSHPCSGNAPWSRDHAVEEYSLERMHDELREANQAIFETAAPPGRAGCPRPSEGSRDDSLD